MAQKGMKIVGWILGLVGLYGILSLLIASINFFPSILTGIWGWVVSIVLLFVGAWMAFK